MTKRIVTIFAATGRQGGGAVEYLCEDGTFHVRAVTRKPDSDAAKGEQQTFLVSVSDCSLKHLLPRVQRLSLPI